jgi:adenylate cyclase class 2
VAKEHEIVVIDIDKQEVERKLKSSGAKYKGHSEYRRIEFLIGGKRARKHSWGRVRTDGKETTITVKRYISKQLPMEEHEISVENFEETVRLISKITLSKPCYFENSRDLYIYKKAKVTIDKWPGIPHYIEIEGPSMAYVKKLYEDMKIKGSFIGNPTLEDVYDRYGLKFSRVVEKDQVKLRKILEG